MKELRQMFTSLKTIGPALLCVSLTAAPALADIIGGALTITATVPGDAATFTVPAPDNARSWIWSSDNPIELRSPTTNNLLAVINPDGGSTRIEFVDDPVIGLGFAVQAGVLPTSFFISSGLLSFAPLTAEGRASAGISITDFDGDGVSLTGLGDPGGSQGAYLAQYNGFAGTISGTTFAEILPSLSAPAFSTDTQNASVPAGPGFVSVGVPVSDMSVLVSFRLSANDFASGTSVYVMQQRPVPVEPTTFSRIKALY